jgi:hypothetical protein
MKTFPLANLKAKSMIRPAGYLEECLRVGVVAGDNVVFTDGAWAGLVAKYSGAQMVESRAPAMPSLEELAGRFWRSVWGWLLSGSRVTRPAEFRARHRQCVSNECGHWQGDRLVARCGACGCTGLKLWLAPERCPKGYWGAVDGVGLWGWVRAVCRRVARRAPAA